jgi:hypothetical protein
MLGFIKDVSESIVCSRDMQDRLVREKVSFIVIGKKRFLGMIRVIIELGAYGFNPDFSQLYYIVVGVIAYSRAVSIMRKKSFLEI